VGGFSPIQVDLGAPPIGCLVIGNGTPRRGVEGATRGSLDGDSQRALCWPPGTQRGGGLAVDGARRGWSRLSRECPVGTRRTVQYDALCRMWRNMKACSFEKYFHLIRKRRTLQKAGVPRQTGERAARLSVTVGASTLHRPDPPRRPASIERRGPFGDSTPYSNWRHGRHGQLPHCRNAGLLVADYDCSRCAPPPPPLPPSPPSPPCGALDFPSPPLSPPPSPAQPGSPALFFFSPTHDACADCWPSLRPCTPTATAIHTPLHAATAATWAGQAASLRRPCGAARLPLGGCLPRRTRVLAARQPHTSLDAWSPLGAPAASLAMAAGRPRRAPPRAPRR